MKFQMCDSSNYFSNSNAGNHRNKGSSKFILSYITKIMTSF